MVNSYNKYIRSDFHDGDQKAFLEKCLLRSGLSSFSAFAKENELHSRVTRDWKNEKYRIPHSLVQKLSKKYEVVLPASYKNIDTLSLQKVAGVKGGQATFKKYGYVGAPLALKQAGWKKWWDSEGSKKLNSILIERKIHIPKYSKHLAEFFGIMLGDGGLTEYQTRVTLNIESDAEYIQYVQSLMYNLFKEKTSLIKAKGTKAVSINVSRKSLTSFLVKNGLYVGNKVKLQIDIPSWITSSQSFSKYCVRGLFDTDGGVFFEKHGYKNKEYSYIRFSFVNMSKPLLVSVHKVLSELGIPSRLNTKRSVTVEGLQNVSKYFILVGTSNPKHSRKYENFRKLDRHKEKWQSGLSHSS